MGDGHRALRARVNEVVQPSHELFVDVVEAERVARAALAAYLEVDGVVDVPVLVRVAGNAVPANQPRRSGERVKTEGRQESAQRDKTSTI